MKAVFLGDSITQGFDLNKHFPSREFKNYGISGFSSQELLAAIKKEWFSIQPDSIFLCIGTNDLAREYNEEETLLCIESLLLKSKAFAPADAQIYLTSLFPTRHNPPRPNTLIRQLNSKLHQLALKLEINYLHLHPFFSDHNGQLKREFTEDGLHLNAIAYRVWKEYLQLLF